MDFQREVVAQDDTRLVTELMQHGMSVITPSDVQLDAFRAAVEPAYKDFEQRIGADIIARCRAEVARARQAQESN
jgi:TRAP-type C4-dicarboxylate transport system substrate-binding protein